MKNKINQQSTSNFADILRNASVIRFRVAGDRTIGIFREPEIDRPIGVYFEVDNNSFWTDVNELKDILADAETCDMFIAKLSNPSAVLYDEYLSKLKLPLGLKLKAKMLSLTGETR